MIQAMKYRKGFLFSTEARSSYCICYIQSLPIPYPGEDCDAVIVIIMNITFAIFSTPKWLWVRDNLVINICIITIHNQVASVFAL